MNPFEQFLDLYGPCDACRASGAAGCDECGRRVQRFCREVFDITPDPWQDEVLHEYGRGERRIAIAACHGPGKTFIASVIIWHQLICRFPQNTVATAPSRAQLEDALVKEVLTQYHKLPEPIRAAFEVKKNRIELNLAREESFFSARTARAEKPEALQGVHCDAGWVLLVGDEASAIEEPIFDSAGGSMSGARVTMLLLSNPTRTSGFFYDVFHKVRDRWCLHQIAASDSTRVDPDFARDIAERYGVDSNTYRIRVLGQFPLSDLDTVIPRHMVDSALKREIVVPFGASEIWGLDVARHGADSSALVARNRLTVTDITVWKDLDLMQLTGRVKKLWDERLPSQRPEDIMVDEIGMGGGVLDRLREMQLPARGVNVAETDSVDPRYRNLRAELWFDVREWLETKNHALPRCAGGCKKDCVHLQLADELVVPKYDFTSSGKIIIESKRDIKARGYHSPNIADALALTFAGEPATLVHGSGSSRGFSNVGWNQPLHRDLSVY